MKEDEHVTLKDVVGEPSLMMTFLCWEKGEIRIAGLSPEVRTIFELTRLHRIFDIYENIETARASFV